MGYLKLTYREEITAPNWQVWTGGSGEKEVKKVIVAQSEGVMLLKETFDANGITIPFPIRTLDFGIKGGTKLSEVLDKGK